MKFSDFRLGILITSCLLCYYAGFLRFSRLAFIAKVGIWSVRASFQGYPRILRAVFAPVPPVRLRSLNILLHPYPPRNRLYSATVIFHLRHERGEEEEGNFANHIRKLLEDLFFGWALRLGGGVMAVNTVRKKSGLILILAFLMLSSSAVAMADAAVSEISPAGPSATGRGWFAFNGRRHNFAFAVEGGKLNETDGWRYAPKGNFSVAVFNFKGDRLVLVKSARIWRFRTEKVDNGSKVVFAGVANVQVAIGVLENWWFRAEARDSTSGDGFSVSLWRTGGANNFGCWTARIFNPEKPGTLRLNPTPFYTAFGRLRGGSVQVGL